jgi:hypothetical protein
MGLDMYLREHHHLSHYENLKDFNDKYGEEYDKAEKILEIIGLTSKVDGSIEVVTTVAYWRKANAIHQWFVDNIQDEVDNCESYYVEDSDLRVLMGLCERVIDSSRLVDAKVVNGQSMVDGEWVDNIVDGKTIANHAVAEDLLPVSEGFFFGGTAYGEWYLEDIVSTLAQLSLVLENKASEFNHFEYQSSW